MNARYSTQEKKSTNYSSNYLHIKISAFCLGKNLSVYPKPVQKAKLGEQKVKMLVQKLKEKHTIAQPTG